MPTVQWIKIAAHNNSFHTPSILDTKKEVCVADIASIFKAYDVRGTVGEQLTAQVSHDIGRALADILAIDGSVAVGRDMRPDSEDLASALIKGLRLQGRDVIDIGQVTSDMIYFAVGSLGLAGGAMITASHNPGKDNGIKLCREEARPIGLESGLANIRDAVLGADFKAAASNRGGLESRDLSEAWIHHVLSFIDTAKLKPMKLAVDAGNGMAGKIFPELEPYVPWDITEMYFELDGTFPNHEANPLKFETLADLIARIKTDGLDGGIAFDGDGDRAFLVDETGTPITGNVMNAMLSEYFLRLHPASSILYDLRSSRVVPETIEKNGGKALRSKVGHANIKQLMREHDVPFGGEVSGHFYFRDNWYADSGLIGAVIGLYAAGLTGKKLSELREHYTPYATLEETNFTVADTAAVFERLKKEFASCAIDELDGVSVMFDDGSWFNVRASNTEPLVRLNAEASTPDLLDVLVKRVTSLI